MCCIQVSKRLHNQQWVHLASHASSLSSILGPGCSQGTVIMVSEIRQFLKHACYILSLYCKWCHFRTPLKSFKQWPPPKTHQASLAHLHWSLPAQISGGHRENSERPGLQLHLLTTAMPPMSTKSTNKDTHIHIYIYIHIIYMRIYDWY